MCQLSNVMLQTGQGRELRGHIAGKAAGEGCKIELPRHLSYGDVAGEGDSLVLAVGLR